MDKIANQNLTVEDEKFEQVYFKGVYFNGGRKCFFVGCVFEACNFKETFIGVDFKNCMFLATCFIDVRFMNESRFMNCSFRYAHFEKMEFPTLCHNNMYFRDCKIKDCTNVPLEISQQTRIVPSEGSFIGWKKVADYRGSPRLAKLLVPESAERSNGFGRKIRVSKAQVLGYYEIPCRLESLIAEPIEIENPKKYYSMYNYSFQYPEVGGFVEPEKEFNPNRFRECASGIHLFLTSAEAINYC